MQQDQYHEGMTLVEMMVASALVAVMAIGLLSIGIKSQAFGEHSRTATEARALAKAGLEEMVAAGIETLRTQPGTLFQATTNLSNRDFPIIRQPSMVWHLPNGAVAASTNGTYAEVHVTVQFWSPLFKRMATNDYAMIIQ